MSRYYTKEKTLRFFLVCLMTCLMLVAGWEVLIFLFPQFRTSTPEELRLRSWAYEPAVFARHVFPQEERFYSDRFWSNEFGLTRRYVNQKGYRGRDFSQEKFSTTIRIIIYGGSVVFDLGMPLGKDWPHAAERLMQQRGFPQVEVINAGIPGHASFDSVGRLFAEGHLFQPDYVLLNNTWNDIKLFSSSQSLLRTLRPYKASENVMTHYQNALDRFLCEHVNLYVVLRQGFLARKLRISAEGGKPRVNYGEYKKIAPSALKQYHLNLEMFVDCARNIGATPVLMTQARMVLKDNESVDGQLLQNAYGMIPSHEFIYQSFIAADHIIRSVAKEKNVSLIDASALMTGKKNLFFDHVHMNLLGSEQLAEIVAEHMVDLMPKP